MSVSIYESVWREGPNIRHARQRAGSVSLGDKIYLIGGQGYGSGSCPYLEIYSPRDNTWTMGKDMPTARTALQCAVYQEKIYCMGGIVSGSDQTSIVEVYDTISDTWQQATSMPRNRINGIAATVGDKIYCIGGSSYFRSTLSYPTVVDIYDISTDSWSVGTDIPETLLYLTAEVYNNKIYCIGGSIISSSVRNGTIYVYDPALDEWGIENTIEPVSLHGSCIIGSDIVICGGETNNRHVYDTCTVYNIETGSSASIAPLNTNGRYRHNSVYANGTIYCIGGVLGNGSSTTPTSSVVYLGSNGNTFSITHRYITTAGTAIRQDTIHTALENNPYTAMAPSVSGYRCVGHRIDDGDRQSGATAAIPNVQGDHTIAFLYEPDGDTGSNEDCHCCAKVEIKVTTCSANGALIQAVNDAVVRQGKDCRCHCNCK